MHWFEYFSNCFVEANNKSIKILRLINEFSSIWKAGTIESP